LNADRVVSLVTFNAAGEPMLVPIYRGTPAKCKTRAEHWRIAGKRVFVHRNTDLARKKILDAERLNHG